MKVSAPDSPRPGSQHEGDLFALEGQRPGNKRQEIEDGGEGNEGEGRVFVLVGGGKGLLLGREETA